MKTKGILLRWDIIILLLLVGAISAIRSDGVPQEFIDNAFDNPGDYYINEDINVIPPTETRVEPYQAPENTTSTNRIFEQNIAEWESAYLASNRDGGGVDIDSLVDNATVQPTQVFYTGGAVTYPYQTFTLYAVFTAPFFATQIILEPGERIIDDIIIGDAANYQISVGDVVNQDGRTPHIFIKPSFEGRKTNMVINTTRRTYNLTLYSFEHTYMPIITWAYVDSLIGATGDDEIVVNANLSELDYNYEILALSDHAPSWQPSTVFSDGTRTFMQFPSAARAVRAPTLFAINKRKRTILNYRVIEDYYVIEGVQDHMELVLDTNLDNIIVIKRR